jgi:dTDP-L-rhamnose 4-epimerase
MKVLVTGGAGFIGTHTCIALLDSGHDVRALDSLMPPVHPGRQRPSQLPGDVELIVGDVRDRDAVRTALDGVDAVIHLAAEQGYGPHFSEFYSVNTVGTALLFELAVEMGLALKKVVVASSQAAYGEGIHRCAVHGLLTPPSRSDNQLRTGSWDLVCPDCGGELSPEETTEDAAIAPSNSYGVSKYTEELVAFNLGRRYGIPVTAYRYSITQGPLQSFSNAYSGICRVFVLRVLAGKRPTAYEDGRQRRDYIWVGDVAAANVLALTDSRTDFEVFNVAGTEILSVAEYGDHVARVLGRPELSPEFPGLYRFGDTRHIISSDAKLRGLGWKQTVAVDDIIYRYAEWAATQSEAADHFDAALAKMQNAGTVRHVATTSIGG